MPSVAVRRLRLTTPPARGAACRQQVEDALRLAAPDEARLLVLRRLELERLPAGARTDAWITRAGDRLRQQRARALHASHPAANSADAVWFRSFEEARTHLLLLLASGRSAEAWFWRLVLPDEFDQPLGAFLARWMSEAGRDEAVAIALARAVVAAAEVGLLQTIAAALPPAMPSWVAHPYANAAEAKVGIAAAGDAATPDRKDQAVSLLARLDARVGAAVATVLAALPRGSAAATWIGRIIVLAAAPELIRNHASCAQFASALIVAVLPGRQTTGRPGMPDQPVALTAATANAPPASAAGDAERALQVAARDRHTLAGHSRAEASRAVVPPEPDVEQASRAAGVLLAIGALDRLGLGARLAADGDAALAGFGRALLCHIASRARTPPDDPLFAILDAPTPDSFAAALHSWRRGLDGWLRRRARVRLAELAGRRGWLLRAGSELHVRLPLSAAELRLRRLALDVDPGWVPWLGLIVRYHFSDTPLR